MRIPSLWIDLVPPSEPHEATAGNIFQVVEVDCKQEDCDDENEDTLEQKRERERG